MSENVKHPAGHPAKHEEEFKGSIWKHPYMLYIVLTGVIFAVLGAIGFLAIQNGWLPSRGL